MSGGQGFGGQWDVSSSTFAVSAGFAATACDSDDLAGSLAAANIAARDEMRSHCAAGREVFARGELDSANATLLMEMHRSAMELAICISIANSQERI